MTEKERERVGNNFSIKKKNVYKVLCYSLIDLQARVFYFFFLLYGQCHVCYIFCSKHLKKNCFGPMVVFVFFCFYFSEMICI